MRRPRCRTPRGKPWPRSRFTGPVVLTTSGLDNAVALHYPASDSFAGLANFLGERGTRLDSLKNLLGFLTIRRSAVAHESNCLVHFGSHRLAFLRRADQLGSHRFDLLGSGFIVAHHGLRAECSGTRNTLSMLDIVRHWPGRDRWRSR